MADARCGATVGEVGAPRHIWGGGLPEVVRPIDAARVCALVGCACWWRPRIWSTRAVHIDISRTGCQVAHGSSRVA